MRSPDRLCRKILLAAFLGVLCVSTAHAQTEVNAVNLARDVGMDQKLGAQIPLDTEFRDSTGKTVRLRDYFGERPVVLVLPFYRCNGSCLMELDGMVRCFSKLSFELGKDFTALAVSIHPKETPEMAAAKKREYEELLKRPGARDGWHFLVGSWDAIQALTQAVGFRFVYDPVKDQIAHATGIIILTPQGRVSRYFYGAKYNPRDVRLALVEASNNRIGTLADKISLYCSTFDLARGRYTPHIMRITQILGVATVILLAAAIFILSRVPADRSGGTAAPPGPGSGPGAPARA
ncbi:MAG: SCO family protein [Chloroherpetonaceae bacterium]|nr:SCO family protein [Chthonomonadaceae bacterium]MDW8207578.1 SCO family protein [Chloroherpetonaceae bacterium]